MHPDKKQAFSLKNRIRSFSWALKGLKVIFIHEHNFRVHIFLALLALIMSVWLHISMLEYAIILLCIVIVLICEIFNSCIEHFLDLLHPDFHPKAGQIKNMGAAAVLIAAIAAFICGLIIFLPKILKVLNL
jgi:diacylglycerol kinase (ATP)